MTVILVMRAIKSFLDAELAGDVSTVPAVHLGFLPTKTHENMNEKEFPFIIIRPLEGEVTDSNRTQIRLLFGTESQDDDGFMDVLNLMERVRIALLKKRVIDHRYRLETPYKWKFYEEQPSPEWIGEATTQWTLPMVLEEVEGL